ncbi:PREDICTED: uncharacterized protein LOC108562804 [Nicrophorus vespilloides]|uniref:Uncharacterized protein LOC108562804 n=1 Tax=Nicrophorus vespilloides TaxID=110193 RepID=A0ABM1MQ77_NICVS|nr:PREDICTED: uncharacterized protein LOC108562804 [Nicrophorus vespilloides]
MSFKLCLIALAAVMVVAVYGAATPLTSEESNESNESKETTLAFKSRPEQNCQCMPFRYCDGVINSDVQCHPSYSHGCCVRPEPEPIPTYVPESEKNEIDDFIEVVRI